MSMYDPSNDILVILIEYKQKKTKNRNKIKH